ncbi:MAG: hypothetical protein KBE04_09550 [Phycisphaerae bacterium]|nr:hypothetical protein [Phycisphaerae bacterium]
MGKRRVWLGVLLAVSACAAAQAEVFTDDFGALCDYLVDGVAGTVWDGMVGLDANQTANAINASVSRPGQLYLESAGAAWAEPWSPIGPFLYKVVQGNFVATVKVTDYAGDVNAPVYHNNCGLMVRNAADADAGPGEDWVSMDYFPIWGCGNFVRAADDGVRSEVGNNGKAFGLDPYLQIERAGDVFHLRTSPDGVVWTEGVGSPLKRTDLAGIPVQVGVFQCTFSGDMGYAAFDDFSVATSAQLKAILVSPEDGKVVKAAPVLEWKAGDTAVSHVVVLGTDPNALAQVAAQAETTFTPDLQIEADVVYYWRVDEVEQDGTVRTGDLWSFVGAKAAPSVFPLVSVRDGFEAAHNFVVDGVAGTQWDGLIASDGTNAVVDANTSRPGQLYLESANGNWETFGAPNLLGPFLYKLVKGDFIASVKVTGYAGDANAPVYHNECGLMARIAADEDAGPGEDFQMNNYFPLWVGNRGRRADNGVMRSGGSAGAVWNVVPYLQIERSGNTFYHRISEDGVTWTQIREQVRDDMAGLPVQVGVWQCTYSDQVGYAAFDEFTLVNTLVDDFEKASNLAADGVAGTQWDGLVVSDGTNAVVDANTSRPGQLYLESVNAVWAEPWNPLGPFVYRVVAGDFVASVKVTDYAGDPNAVVYHNNCGLMARNVVDADAGDGEDWVSIDYFPIWNCGNFIRTANNGVRRERNNNGLAWNLYPYLQLERQGNTFFFRVSADGITWIDMPGSPRTHSDFDGLPMAVGLFQCTYSDSVGYAAFDGFSITQ